VAAWSRSGLGGSALCAAKSVLVALGPADLYVTLVSVLKGVNWKETVVRKADVRTARYLLLCDRSPQGLGQETDQLNGR
jgi:hypothetical protein